MFFLKEHQSPPSSPRMAAQIAQGERLIRLDPMCSTGDHRWEDCQGRCAFERYDENDYPLTRDAERLIREPVYFDEGTARSEKSASIA